MSGNIFTLFLDDEAGAFQFHEGITHSTSATGCCQTSPYKKLERLSQGVSLQEHEQLTIPKIADINARLVEYLAHPNRDTLSHPFVGDEFLPNMERLGELFLSHLQSIFIGGPITDRFKTNYRTLHIRWKERIFEGPYERVREYYGTAYYHSGEMCISKYQNNTRNQLLNTILHEFCHMWAGARFDYNDLGHDGHRKPWLHLAKFAGEALRHLQLPIERCCTDRDPNQHWYRCPNISCIYEVEYSLRPSPEESLACPNCQLSLFRVWSLERPLNWYQFFIHHTKQLFILPLDQEIWNMKEQVSKDLSGSCEERLEWLRESGQTVDASALGRIDWRAVREEILVAPVQERKKKQQQAIEKLLEDIKSSAELQAHWTNLAREVFDRSQSHLIGGHEDATAR